MLIALIQQIHLTAFHCMSAECQVLCFLLSGALLQLIAPEFSYFACLNVDSVSLFPILFKIESIF